jgi:hypothetical protein
LAFGRFGVRGKCQRKTHSCKVPGPVMGRLPFNYSARSVVRVSMGGELTYVLAL